MWGLGRLQVHGICSRKLVRREAVETRLNYKRTWHVYMIIITYTFNILLHYFLIRLNSASEIATALL